MSITSNKNDGNKSRIMICSVLVIISTIILITSFISIEPSTSLSNNGADGKDTNGLNESPRVVFLVIDALRLSFLTSPKSPMSFTRESIMSGHAVGFNAYARMPTVTLPRIMAYISGTLPSFGTILTNLASEEIKVENWITSMKRNGKIIHFYGDDTWIKLLPNAFNKYEGVTSFFVNDFTQVDDNVTRHLDEELESRQWDALILHYLGLDHIGHSLGGTSKMIDVKLKEMDKILETIYTRLAKMNRQTYIIACGDHGMSAGGSHGGASRDESRVPIVVWSTKGLKRIARDESLVEEENFMNVEQIDLSSTIYSLMGMKEPMKVAGISLIESLSKVFEFDEGFVERQMGLMYSRFSEIARENGLQQLLTITCDENHPCDFSKKFVQKTLLEDFRNIQQELVSTSAVLPVLEMFISVVILILAFFISISSWKKSEQSQLGCYGFFMINLLFVSSSFVEEEHEIWYYLCSSILVIKIFQNSNKKSDVFYLLALSLLHRTCVGWNQNLRRRWIMEPSLLPQKIFADFEPFWNLSLYDAKELFNHFQSPIIFIPFIFILQNLLQLPIAQLSTLLLPFLSHSLRQFNFDEIDAFFLIFARAIIFFVIIKYRTLLPLVSFILILTPIWQIPLMFLIAAMGYLMAKMPWKEYEFACFLLATFYYTSNSNSLATLSLSSAYVGLLDYYPVIVGIQLSLFTFAGPIIFIIGWNIRKNNKESGKILLFYFLSYRILNYAMSIVLLFIFRNHIFVWSVYTPKTCYDMFNCLFSMVIVILFNF